MPFVIAQAVSILPKLPSTIKVQKSSKDQNAKYAIEEIEYVLDQDYAFPAKGGKRGSLFAVTGPKLVGALNYDVDKKGQCYIHHLGSLAKGVGTALVNRLVNEVKPIADTILLNTYGGSEENFYKRLGFEEIDKSLFKLELSSVGEFATYRVLATGHWNDAFFDLLCKEDPHLFTSQGADPSYVGFYNDQGKKRSVGVYKIGKAKCYSWTCSKGPVLDLVKDALEDMSHTMGMQYIPIGTFSTGMPRGVSFAYDPSTKTANILLRQ